ncbi:HNH endonuclease [Candidatus Atribacteria bacterium 1244-E10-H5-B2]|nr:MAG: HNH endonuclease [Candidatus Atribacteria bacterium 1244-E10-H5-B2]
MKINLETLKETQIFYKYELKEENLTERERSKYLKGLKFLEKCLKQYGNKNRNIEAKKYYQEHKEQYKESNRRWREKNKEKYSEYKRKKNREWDKKNKKYVKKKNKERYRDHKKEHLEYCREYERDRRRTDLKFNLNIRMRRRIGDSLKGKANSRKWESLVGYTLNDLVDRLKNTMPKGYAWRDFLQGKLHIDHIIPISAFNFNCPDHTDFKRCWALENLRLLPAKENMIKHDRLDRPFQPALKI